MKPAFVVIDMQKQGFLENQSRYPKLADTAPLINHISSIFRQAKLPVIWVQDHEGCDLDDPLFEIVECLKVNTDDLRVNKIYGNSFRDTKLTDIVKKYNINFLLLAGFMAEACVLSTAKGAEDRDIAYAILRNGIVSQNRERVQLVEDILPLISYEVVEILLKQNVRKEKNV